jgi:micrococcal nuclease
MNREKMKKALAYWLLLAICALGVSSCKSERDYEKISVIRVIDGDTLELEDKERVRLIGIDTPETRLNSKLERDARRTERDYKTIIAMGEAATQFTRRLVLGQSVRLEFDAEKRDRYGRLLAYVYLADGRMLNAEIVREGYGQVYTVVPNVKYADLFLALQREARDEKRGLWGE